MGAPRDLTALRTAISLTVRFIEKLHADTPTNWAAHRRDFIAALKASGLRDEGVMAALLSVADDEQHRCVGRKETDVSPFEAAGIDEMLEKFDHDAQLFDAADRPSGRTARVRRVTQFIEEHLDEQLTLDRLARVVGRHRVNLATEFRSETGLTVHQYLTRVRMVRAADLLRRGCKIDAAILLVGYFSKKNFYQHFKEQMGMTPGAFKKLEAGKAALGAAGQSEVRSPRPEGAVNAITQPSSVADRRTEKG
jgi:AraC-like DNA-binding protein